MTNTIWERRAHYEPKWRRRSLVNGRHSLRRKFQVCRVSVVVRMPNHHSGMVHRASAAVCRAYQVLEDKEEIPLLWDVRRRLFLDHLDTVHQEEPELRDHQRRSGDSGADRGTTLEVVAAAAVEDDGIAVHLELDLALEPTPVLDLDPLVVKVASADRQPAVNRRILRQLMAGRALQRVTRTHHLRTSSSSSRGRGSRVKGTPSNRSKGDISKEDREDREVKEDSSSMVGRGTAVDEDYAFWYKYRMWSSDHYRAISCSARS